MSQRVQAILTGLILSAGLIISALAATPHLPSKATGWDCGAISDMAEAARFAAILPSA